MIAIDNGFGYTKAVSNTKKTLFPSAIAPSQADDLTFDEGSYIGHIIELKKPGEIKKRVFSVGEKAIKEGRAVQLSQDCQKFSKEATAILSLAAAYLVGGEGPTRLAMGLPIKIYRDKEYREVVKRSFDRIAYNVRVDGGPEKYITFCHTECFAQGVGAVYSLETLPSDGLVGLLDVGFNTTDMVLFECHKGNKPEPLKSYFRSVNFGVSNAYQLFIDSVAELTGASISFVKAMEIWDRESVTYRGVKYNIGQIKNDAKANSVKAIFEAINEAWKEKIEWLDHVLLAGGGAIELGDTLTQMIPQSTLVEDPQFANANGYFKIMGILQRAKGKFIVA